MHYDDINEKNGGNDLKKDYGHCYVDGREKGRGKGKGRRRGKGRGKRRWNV
ncbi:hypothetical protein G9A89_006690 [Geosiphon pyriformis]|nr:hypothetical protein G9A89_006690 [Geosiphon pyriformis]